MEVNYFEILKNRIVEFENPSSLNAEILEGIVNLINEAYSYHNVSQRRSAEERLILLQNSAPADHIQDLFRVIYHLPMKNKIHLESVIIYTSSLLRKMLNTDMIKDVLSAIMLTASSIACLFKPDLEPKLRVKLAGCLEFLVTISVQIDSKGNTRI